MAAQENTGRLSNTSANPADHSAHPGKEAPVGQVAQQVTHDDLAAHPETEDGAVDRARIVPPANQGDTEEVTEHLGPDAGATVY